MSNTVTQNAVIESVSLCDDEHGGLTFWLFLDYGGSAQGFGGFGFGPDDGPPLVFAHLALREVLRVVGARKWEDLKGKTCRAEGTWSGVTGIGHITKDVWFRPEEAFAPYRDSEYRVQQTTRLAQEAKAVLDLLVKHKGEDFAAKSYEVRFLRERLAKIGGAA